MSVFLGGQEVSQINLGSQSVSEVYLGSQKIWPAVPPGPSAPIVVTPIGAGIQGAFPQPNPIPYDITVDLTGLTPDQQLVMSVHIYGTKGQILANNPQVELIGHGLLTGYAAEQPASNNSFRWTAFYTAPPGWTGSAADVFRLTFEKDTTFPLDEVGGEFFFRPYGIVTSLGTISSITIYLQQIDPPLGLPAGTPPLSANAPHTMPITLPAYGAIFGMATSRGNVGTPYVWTNDLGLTITAEDPFIDVGTTWIANAVGANTADTPGNVTIDASTIPNDMQYQITVIQ